jgi:molybdopterin converting factor small subunit
LKRTARKWKRRRKSSRKLEVKRETLKVDGRKIIYFLFSGEYNKDMPTVRFPAVMKYYVNNQAEFSIAASSVQDLIEQVVQQYPSVKFHLLDSEGQLRRHFNIFINGIHIRDLNGMETPLKEDDKVILMASAAGGY